MKVQLTQIFILLFYWSLLQGQDTTNPLQHITSENIGPTVFGGRVVDIEVNPDNPVEFYVAYASGGLWHTTNNGQSLTPIFDNQPVISIGDFAVIWDAPRTLIVGTGEVNSSRSSYYGKGIFRSTDNGDSWSFIGLEDTQHIGRVLVNPNNRNEIFVASMGALYSKNAQRGIYKSTDGGDSWEQSLFLNDSTGVVDLILHPENPDILYAAAWERDRKAWNFKESGASSGIYKTIDGGDSWKRLNTIDSGFPSGEGVGRIGLDITVDNQGREILYAILDNYNRRPPEDQDKQDGLSKDDFEDMSKDQFLALKKVALEEYLNTNGFPKKYTVEIIKARVQAEELKPVALKEYVEDANSLLFDTPVIGAEVYKSMDGGMKWTKTHVDYLDAVYNSYGYYFGQIRVSPHNPEKIYIMGVPILRSDDGGKTFTGLDKENVHVDHHDLWINPKLDGHLILGNDGGVNISYDDGKTWNNVNDIGVGQFYYIYADDAEPYSVYGGTQDNGVWKGPHSYRRDDSWQSLGNYPYERILGGDGMQVQVDGEGHIYTGFQFGNYYRMHDDKKNKYITPKHELGERPYRWNWQAPILLSPHNDRILYMGANRILRSMNQGEDFTPISPDLTRGGRKGDVAYGTITTFDESRDTFGKMVSGSDDGLIYVTSDSGKNWNKVWESKPDEKWVSRVVISQFNDDVIYAAVNNMRHDDFAPYLMQSVDFGKSWIDITGNLPHFSINVIKEDPKNPDILYVGTDAGAFISLDQGKSYHKLMGALPNVPVHDIVVKNDDLLLGTHGRSIYKMPLSAVRAFNESDSEGLEILAVDDIRYNSRWGWSYASWADKTEPDYSFSLYSEHSGPGSYEILAENKVIAQHPLEVKAGIAAYDLLLTFDEKHQKHLEKIVKKIEKAKIKKVKQGKDGNFYLIPGKYLLKVKLASQESRIEFNIDN